MDFREKCFYLVDTGERGNQFGDLRVSPDTSNWKSELECKVLTSNDFKKKKKKKMMRFGV